MKPPYSRNAVSPALLISALALAACATSKPPVISYDDPQPAVLQPEPPRPVEVVALPIPLPLPGQLKAVSDKGPSPREPADPRTRVDQANLAARVEPSRDGYVNAVQVYPFSSGALYQVYAAPGQVTDIALQESEQLSLAIPKAGPGQRSASTSC
jgi:type IV secretion system protein VirB9